MVAIGRMCYQTSRDFYRYRWLASFHKVAVQTHMVVRAFTNHNYHPNCQCLWQAKVGEPDCHLQVASSVHKTLLNYFGQTGLGLVLLVRALKGPVCATFYTTLR